MASRDETWVAETTGKKNAYAAGRDPESRDKCLDMILRRVLDAEPGELHEHLRFQEASIYNARASILDEYRAPGGFTLGKCRDHLHFLYLTHQLRRSDDELRDMAIVDHELRLIKPWLRDIYLPGASVANSPDSPEELFRPMEGPVFAASYVHPTLFESPPAQPEPTHPAWIRWLCDFLGVRDRIRLLSRSGGSLADSFLYVAKHRKYKVLGVLEQVWRIEGAALDQQPALKQMIGQISVPIISGGFRRLWETYLPFESLRNYSGQFLGGDETFPFLDLGYPTTAEELRSKWSFLCTHFSVSADDDVGFLLDILGHIRETNSQGLPANRCRDVALLYYDIETKCMESVVAESVRDIVRTFVADINGIAIPESPNSPAQWVGPLDCVWDAPIEMTTKQPVQAIYETVLECPPAAMAILSNFFQETLSVSKMGWADLTTELAALSENNSENGAHS